uniref:Uncharacterized protein n=1 Tax=Chromera velia CCMP2878 TaxID=1169474 RepID=A0A0G4HZW4_9ALVE|eukprot:Cvel_9821.t1-p1 / transcript=Cvel_9821.t1 / gene=Cvel_9821 / organism=Chromera_velia_CCMP2878 / gene_product=hypothetical protein / transcript_product=hypothetical protein / location=Cvel_scaffold576:73381-77084(-) / protein_length=791 / sequence_SO=supercontig / SO=protein_coding / is_pseudo=false
MLGQTEGVGGSQGNALVERGLDPLGITQRSLKLAEHLSASSEEASDALLATTVPNSGGGPAVGRRLSTQQSSVAAPASTSERDVEGDRETAGGRIEDVNHQETAGGVGGLSLPPGEVLEAPALSTVRRATSSASSSVSVRGREGGRVQGQTHFRGDVQAQQGRSERAEPESLHPRVSPLQSVHGWREGLSSGMRANTALLSAADGMKLRRLHEKTQEDLKACQRKLADSGRENERLKRELQDAKQTERRLKAQVRRLEVEVETLHARQRTGRTAFAPQGSRTPSRSRSLSPQGGGGRGGGAERGRGRGGSHMAAGTRERPPWGGTGRSGLPPTPPFPPRSVSRGSSRARTPSPVPIRPSSSPWTPGSSGLGGRKASPSGNIPRNPRGMADPRGMAAQRRDTPPPRVQERRASPSWGRAPPGSPTYLRGTSTSKARQVSPGSIRSSSSMGGRRSPTRLPSPPPWAAASGPAAFGSRGGSGHVAGVGRKGATSPSARLSPPSRGGMSSGSSRAANGGRGRGPVGRFGGGNAGVGGVEREPRGSPSFSRGEASRLGPSGATAVHVDAEFARAGVPPTSMQDTSTTTIFTRKPHVPQPTTAMTLSPEAAAAAARLRQRGATGVDGGRSAGESPKAETPGVSVSGHAVSALPEDAGRPRPIVGEGVRVWGSGKGDVGGGGRLSSAAVEADRGLRALLGGALEPSRVGGGGKEEAGESGDGLRKQTRPETLLGGERVGGLGAASVPQSCGLSVRKKAEEFGVKEKEKEGKKEVMSLPDIDARLSALQAFLRNARSTS